MAESPNIGDLFGAFGGNPLAGVGRLTEQLRRSVSDLVATVELMRATMENLNAAASRVNRLLDDVEEPMRIAVPQLTRTVRVASTMVDQLMGPVERVAPGLERLADTLGSSVFAALPGQIADTLDSFAELGRRLAPITQLADAAGGLFGLKGLGSLPGFPRGATAGSGAATGSEPPKQSPPKQAGPSSEAPKPVAKKPVAKKPAAKKPATKKAAAKKAAATTQPLAKRGSTPR